MSTTADVSPPLDPRCFAALAAWLREQPLRLRVRRDCMAPDLPAGARVEIVPARFPLPGDAVAFRAAGGALLVHRVIGYRPRAGGLSALTQADAAGAADRPVPRAAVLGRAARYEDADGRWRPVPRRPLRALARLFLHLAQRAIPRGRALRNRLVPPEQRVGAELASAPNLRTPARGPGAPRGSRL